MIIRACRTDDVPLGEGRALTVDDRRIAIFHAPTGWFALDAACPHQGGPLQDGIVSDCTVTCPLHERRFSLATGEALSGGEHVATHRVLLRGEEVWLEVAAARAVA